MSQGAVVYFLKLLLNSFAHHPTLKIGICTFNQLQNERESVSFGQAFSCPEQLTKTALGWLPIIIIQLHNEFGMQSVA